MKKYILDIAIIFLLAFIVIAGIQIFCETDNYKKGKSYYQGIKGNVVVDDTNSLSDDRMINFINLHKSTPNYNGKYAWIYIPNTEIDYPVIQGEDNETYLHLGPDGNKMKVGSIFIDYRNKDDFSDFKTIIYGHNMHDGSMFHDLHKYKDDAYINEHSNLYIYLDNDSIKKYKFLCTINTTYNDSSIYEFNDENNIKLLTRLLSKATKASDSFTTNNIVILSTCIKGDARFDVIFQEY